LQLIVNDLRIPVEKDGIDEYHKAASAKLGLAIGELKIIRILHKYLDMSDKEQFYYNIELAVSVPAGFENKYNLLPYNGQSTLVSHANPAKWKKARPVIIGFGPAGMFAAIELIGHGIQPIIFERGKKLEDRHVDVDNFIKHRTLNTESNIQFGEGGAGSYSDGKLFSRANNTRVVKKVLDTFIKFGAPGEIGFVHKPHLGTDVLCKIVFNIRNYILENGGQINYSSKMTDLLVSNGKAAGVVINGKDEYPAPVVFAAIGHSSRDTFEVLSKNGITLSQKPISVGLRIEHDVETINLLRYGEKYKDFRALGAANYSFNFIEQKNKRQVSTFCMCPGGEIVNASSENGMLVTNGMSYFARSSAFSNSAIIVRCHTEDYGSPLPLAGIEFQKTIERKAFTAGGGNWQAPAQNLPDFMANRVSGALNKNSFKLGTVPASFNEILPKFITEALFDAFNDWKKDCPPFVSDKAVLVGPETRTSCPVKIERGADYQSLNLKNLYPIGEGSGYTGGITSSAADAIKAVEASMTDTH
jgi:hypothetical protein